MVRSHLAQLSAPLLAAPFGPLCAALLTLAAPSVRAGAPPSLPAMQARYGDAVLRVHSLDGARTGVGFFVGTEGVAVAALAGSDVGDGVVIERPSGDRLRARIAYRAAKGPLRVVEVVDVPTGPFPRMRLSGTRARLNEQDWLVGVCVDDAGRPAPSLGGLRRIDRGRWHLDMPCAAGTPVLDAAGAVVAVVVDQTSANRSEGVSSQLVRRMLEMYRETTRLPVGAPKAAVDVPVADVAAAAHSKRDRTSP